MDPPPATVISPGQPLLDADTLHRLGHDLRASLRAIDQLPLWIAEDLEEAGHPPPDTVATALALIRRHGHRMELILDGWLQLALAGRDPPEAVPLGDALAQALAAEPLPEATRLRTRLGGHAVTMARADAVRAFRVVLANAVQHRTGPGVIRILATARGDRVEVAVIDDGPGIPAARRAELCRPMTRMRAQDEQDGAGMGLAVLSRIVDLWGGRLDIGAPSNPARTGTIIRLSLPRADPG